MNCNQDALKMGSSDWSCGSVEKIFGKHVKIIVRPPAKMSCFQHLSTFNTCSGSWCVCHMSSIPGSHRAPQRKNSCMSCSLMHCSFWVSGSVLCMSLASMRPRSLQPPDPRLQSTSCKIIEVSQQATRESFGCPSNESNSF